MFLHSPKRPSVHAHYQFRCDDDATNACVPLVDPYGCRKILADTIIGLPRDCSHNLIGTSSHADWRKCRMTNRFCRAPYFSSLASHPELVRKQEVGWVFRKSLVKSNWWSLLCVCLVKIYAVGGWRFSQCRDRKINFYHSFYRLRTSWTSSGCKLAVAGCLSNLRDWS